MARRKFGTVFTEAVGKTVDSIRYEEGADWQALEVAFSDGTLFSFELRARVAVQASYFEVRRGDLETIRGYGKVSGDSPMDT